MLEWVEWGGGSGGRQGCTERCPDLMAGLSRQEGSMRGSMETIT